MYELQPEDIDLVESVARSMEPRSRVPWEELQSLGWLGLLDAARRFDPSRHADFATYAVHRIRGEVKDRLRVEYGWITKERKKSRLRPQLLDEDQWEKVLSSVGVLDKKLFEERELIGLAMEHMTPRYQQVFRMRYWEGLNEKEIGVFMGVCEGRISQILRKGKEQLRQAMEAIEHPSLAQEPVDEPLLAL